MYALYKPSEQFGSTKRGGKAIDFTSYFADIINTNTHLTAQEIEGATQQRESWKKLVIACTLAGDKLIVYSII